MILKRTSLILIVGLVISLSGCIGSDSQPTLSAVKQMNPSKISQSELAQLIQNEKEFLLIDVRTEGEYNEGHLPGAIVIPYDEFETRYQEIIDYKDHNIILYCHTGGMGDYAGSVLIEKGFSNVKNLEGGIYGWINSGGEISLDSENHNPNIIPTLSLSRTGLAGLDYWETSPDKDGCELVEQKYSELHNYTYPYLVKEAIKEEVIPSDIPLIYGEELNVSFDGDTDLMTEILRRFENHPLNDVQMRRYIDVGMKISCEYCCSAKTLIFENGERACGCAHSYAMRGLAKYLIINHPDDFTNEDILLELGKWKATFFPKQTISKALIKYSEFGKIDSSILIEMPNMVGRC